MPRQVEMKKRHRLSRSRDFDAVYRRGRSFSTRYLVLYSFERDVPGASPAPRLGLAVSRKLGSAVVRNRVKRLLKSAFDELAGGLAPERDYVVIVRPGFAEAAEARGLAWVTERLEEVVRLAAGTERRSGPGRGETRA